MINISKAIEPVSNISNDDTLVMNALNILENAGHSDET